MNTRHETRSRRIVGAAGFILVTLLILLAPTTYFQIQDSVGANQRYPVAQKSASLSSEISDVKIVQTIHNYLQSSYAENEAYLLNADHSLTIENLEGEEQNRDQLEGMLRDGLPLQEMADFLKSQSDTRLLDYVPFLKSLGELETEVDATSDYETGTYDLYTDENLISFYYDSDSDRILMLLVSSPSMEEFTKEEQLEIQWKYIEYLNLDLISDWYTEDASYLSNKAHLRLDTSYTEDGIFELKFQVI